ncbi:MAG: helix-turn-helix transcriptional regulator [Dehalococcoidia bacterium]
MNRTDRLLGILLELQARGELRAEDLAERFEVSVRSIYRDMQAISESGVPLLSTPGKGYRLMDGYFLPPLSFTEDEAALLMLGGEFIRGRVDSELQRSIDDALCKLTGILPADKRDALARWRRELLFPSVRESSNESTLVHVRRSIQQRQVVRLRYRAYRREQAEWRDVEPTSLVHLQGRWHVAGFCRLRQSLRIFRLDRIDQVELLDERFPLSERHNVDSCSRSLQGEFVEARIRFEPAVERWIRERQPFIFLREELDSLGPVYVYALRNEQELVNWLLSWGAAVEVMSPPSLRVLLAAEAQRIVERHSEATRSGQFHVHSPPPDMMLSGAPP